MNFFFTDTSLVNLIGRRNGPIRELDKDIYFENGDYDLIYKSEKEVTVTMFELQNQHSMKSTAQ